MMPVYLGWRWYRSAHYESILTGLYNASAPPALRSSYLNELLDRYNQRTFDSLVLTGVNFDHINLNGVSFRSATLRSASFRNGSLRQASFQGADLSGAIFSHADLKDADLRGAKLVGADLTDANLTGAKLQDADLANANLTGSNVSPVQLDEAIINDKTILSREVITIQIAQPSQLDKAKEIAAELRNLGYMVPPDQDIQIRGMISNNTYLRYFFKSDELAANRIVNQIRAMGVHVEPYPLIGANDLGQVYPGDFELRLGRNYKP
jgi:hypothetical protein